jgi:Ni/Co efflux regulator RcnB
MTRTAIAVLTFTLIATPVAAQQAPDLRQAAKTVRYETMTTGDSTRSAPTPRKREMSGATRGVLTAIAGVGGFFAGGYIGAAIEGPCDCDDPGFMGAIIGAPVGAATAAIVTWFLTGRD